ncbi:MAG TPA: MerR family transcriptional regulator, partial [Flavisolibacter sp.]
MAYTIRELESLSGIRAHTIRIWEQRYHFLRPSRTPTNIRTYSGNELKTLLTVALLNKYGYRISRIDEMPEEERTKAILRLPQPDARIEFAVNTMIGFMADLDSAGLEAFLDAWITGNGLEQAVTTLIFRFMDKVGILWQTSRILPAQEHLVSCIIRQKIIAAIDKLPAVHNRKTRFVL